MLHVHPFNSSSGSAVSIGETSISCVTDNSDSLIIQSTNDYNIISSAVRERLKKNEMLMLRLGEGERRAHSECAEADKSWLWHQNDGNRNRLSIPILHGPVAGSVRSPSARHSTISVDCDRTPEGVGPIGDGSAPAQAAPSPSGTIATAAAVGVHRCLGHTPEQRFEKDMLRNSAAYRDELHETRNELERMKAMVGALSRELRDANERISELEHNATDADKLAWALENTQKEKEAAEQLVLELQSSIAGRPVKSRRLSEVPGAVSEIGVDPKALQKAYLEMDETAARQDVLLEMFFDPLYAAFDAGCAWLTNIAAMRGELSCGKAISQIDQRTACTGRPRSAPAPSTPANMYSISLESELEVARVRIAHLESIVARQQLALRAEERRNAQMAQTHLQRIREISAWLHVSREKALEVFQQEVEIKIKKAFDEGKETARKEINSNDRELKTIENDS